MADMWEHFKNKKCEKNERFQKKRKMVDFGYIFVFDNYSMSSNFTPILITKYSQMSAIFKMRIRSKSEHFEGS